MGQVERPADRLRLAPAEAARFRTRQAGEGAQQRRLALAVGARDPDDRAGLEAKAEAAEQRALAAAALQPLRRSGAAVVRSADRSVMAVRDCDR
jgi:hypothetical protein